jgi:hypothetical protein
VCNAALADDSPAHWSVRIPSRADTIPASRPLSKTSARPSLHPECRRPIASLSDHLTEGLVWAAGANLGQRAGSLRQGGAGPLCLEDLEIETPPLGNIGIGQLIASIDHSWDTRDQIRAKVGRRLPELKRRASQTNQFLMRLLRDRPSG